MADTITGQQLHYTFDAPGPNYADSSGNGRTASTVYGTPTQEGGRLSNAIGFDGAFGTQIAHSANMGTHNNVSIAFFCKLDALNASWMNQVYGTNGTANGVIQAFFAFAQKFRVDVVSKGTVEFGTPADWPLDTWFHLVLTLESDGTAKLYKNGVLFDTKTFGSAVPFPLTAGTIGNDSTDWNRTFNGQLDEFKLYSRALSDEDVQALYREYAQIDEKPDAIIMQRPVGFNTRVVPFTGTYNIGAILPWMVQVQLYDMDGNVAIPWQNLNDYSYNNGEWQGSLIVPCGMYRHQARVLEDDATISEVTGISVGRWGIGMIFVCAGQSNMYNMFVGSPAQTPYDETSMGGFGNWYDMMGDGAVNLANALYDATGIPVGLINCAVGGSTISDWADYGSPWVDMGYIITENGGDIEGFLWHQGEADAVAGTTKETYKAQLNKLYDRLLAFIPREPKDFQFGCAIVGSVDHVGVTNARMQAIREAQMEWIAQRPFAYWLGCSIDRGQTDGFHWNEPDYGVMGNRYAKGIACSLGEIVQGSEGPLIRRASITGDEVTVFITQNGGTELLDLNGDDSGNDISGFEVSDDNFATTIAISASEFDGNTIKLTLVETPTDEVQVRYQYGRTPDISNGVYDNAPYGGDSLGMPLQPKSAFYTTNGDGGGYAYPRGDIFGLTIYG